jgi:CPA2 family monovalent cation:H+ antiporter-2
VRAYAGDAASRGLLVQAGAGRAALVIVALPDVGPARTAVQQIRALNPEVTILARAHARDDAERLRQAGATEVIQPELEASATLIRHALASLKLPKGLAVAYVERFRAATEEAPYQAAPPAPQVLPEVRQVRIRQGAVTDQSLREARIRERYGVTVVAVSRGDDVILNPPPETILRAGDTARVFGLPDQIAAFTDEAEG